MDISVNVDKPSDLEPGEHFELKIDNDTCFDPNKAPILLMCWCQFVKCSSNKSSKPEFSFPQTITFRKSL